MNRRTIMLIFIAILVIALLIGMVIGNGKENEGTAQLKNT